MSSFCVGKMILFHTNRNGKLSTFVGPCGSKSILLSQNIVMKKKTSTASLNPLKTKIEIA